MKHRLPAALLSACLASTVLANTADYPVRPIQIVVPVAAGGNTDVATRLLADAMKADLGQALIVENRTGAGGAIGTDYVARARPDGYTLLSASNGQLAVNPVVNSKITYDPIKDFSPIGLVFRVPLALTVPPNSPLHTVEDFLKAASPSGPGVTIGTSGTGGAQHIMVERLRGQTGIKLVLVPYRGGSALLPDLMGGTIDATLNELPNVIELHREKKVRIIAISSAEPSEILPGIPTLSASGVPGYTAYSTNGWLAPAGVPDAIIGKLSTSLAKALREPAILKRFSDMGLEAVAQNEVRAQVFSDFIKEDLATNRDIVRKYNIPVQ